MPARERVDDTQIEKFRIDQQKPMIHDGPRIIMGWGKNGLPMTDDKNSYCLAKIEEDERTRTKRFFVRCSTTGRTKGQMVDPNDVLDMGRSADWTPSGRFGWKSVSLAVFTLYRKFLETGNPIYLRQAERE